MKNKLIIRFKNLRHGNQIIIFFIPYSLLSSIALVNKPLIVYFIIHKRIKLKSQSNFLSPVDTNPFQIPLLSLLRWVK